MLQSDRVLQLEGVLQFGDPTIRWSATIRQVCYNNKGCYN